ncbi:hypothetical protein ACGFY9_24445 [Streptomyces sp. NPDC048504]|uniref:hypothetical protein n=1 Tax=Streptomyces sp. NPDC048504 TaxID=3365559 RepID=UPI0037116031
MTDRSTPAPFLAGRRVRRHTAATLLMLSAVAALAALHRAVVDAGTERRAAADRGCLPMAPLAAAVPWGCAAVAY